MGIRYAGWLCGMVALFVFAALTAYTAKLLAKCMDLDPSLITFSDLAFTSFGRNARIATSILFTLELLAACVALIVLFADSLHLLFPGLLTLTGWKTFCAFILIPLNFLPLRLLSFTSIIGIISCLSSEWIDIHLLRQKRYLTSVKSSRPHLTPRWLHQANVTRISP